MDRQVPQGMQVIEKHGAHVMYENGVRNDGSLFWHAFGYPTARTVKPSFNYTFRSQANMEQFIEGFFGKVERMNQRRKERAAERKARFASFSTGLQVGDMLVYSWGYEQTNVDYFQVVRVVGKATVELRAIGGETSQEGGGPMSGHSVPRKDAFLRESPVIRKRVRPDGFGGESVSMDHGSARKWDGRPNYVSWYA